MASALCEPLSTHLNTHQIPPWRYSEGRLVLSFSSNAVSPLTFDGDLLALKVVQVAQQHLLPVASVADEPQVRQGALR